MTQQSFYKAINLEEEESRRTPLAVFDRGRLIDVW
jgi:hypothetical protein